MAGPLMGNIDFNQVSWLKALNIGETDIPPFGLVQVTSTDANGILSVEQPLSDSVDCCINGVTPIHVDTYGVVTRHDPFFALIDTTTNSPPPVAAGQVWGAGQFSDSLTYGKTGFLTLGPAAAAAVSLNQTRVLVTRQGAGGGDGGFWALIAYPGGDGVTAKYPWQEAIWQANGTPVAKTGGRTGTTAVRPAWEASGNTKVNIGTPVWMRPGFLSTGTDGQNYVFEGGPTIAPQFCLGDGNIHQVQFLNGRFWKTV